MTWLKLFTEVWYKTGVFKLSTAGCNQSYVVWIWNTKNIATKHPAWADVKWCRAEKLKIINSCCNFSSLFIMSLQVPKNYYILNQGKKN